MILLDHILIRASLMMTTKVITTNVFQSAFFLSVLRKLFIISLIKFFSYLKPRSIFKSIKPDLETRIDIII